MDALITLTGNLGTEVDRKTFEQKNSEIFTRAEFRLACTPRYRRGNDWVDGTTTWVTVVCTNRLADNVSASLGKGDPVIVTGRLRTQTWTTDDTRHERLVVEASSIGHDLGRGTTRFTRSQVPRPEPAEQDDRWQQPDPAETQGEMEERLAG
ncbi:single-stranded DNA-binding protein [Brooklawnia cerclae]|uniref:Single-stranded DNA-binding protein n=1 Tax=Brooklawnia cerclae TaxID=349934 RepID=A0ABX0SHC8_9ACTN|nr:single-stranded DNA-binding protein [Brooklawnia cerclae]NIH57361.1 single-strand DNA-binding protein [Brooklawnia cerclae]